MCDTYDNYSSSGMWATPGDYLSRAHFMIQKIMWQIARSVAFGCCPENAADQTSFFNNVMGNYTKLEIRFAVAVPNDAHEISTTNGAMESVHGFAHLYSDAETYGVNVFLW